MEIPCFNLRSCRFISECVLGVVGITRPSIDKGTVCFHAFNLAAITAAICTGKESHEDPSKRWVAGIAAGIFYILVGIFGVTLAAVFAAFPTAFISTLAGLALLGTIAGSLANAMSDVDSREAALITFVATAANISLFGIGGAFWGLVLGLISYLVLNGKFKFSS